MKNWKDILKWWTGRQLKFNVALLIVIVVGRLTPSYNSFPVTSLLSTPLLWLLCTNAIYLFIGITDGILLKVGVSLKQKYRRMFFIGFTLLSMWVFGAILIPNYF